MLDIPGKTDSDLMKTLDPPYESERFLARNLHVMSQQRADRRSRFLVNVALLALILVVLLWAYASSGRTKDVAEIKYAWVQMMPDEPRDKPGGRMVRAIIAEAGKCPTLKEDGRTVTMRRRSPPSRSAFPVMMCEAEVRAGSSARLDDRTLPTRPAEPNDIVVIGDTGCRMASHEQDQSCFDNHKWPFKRNALSAAALVSDQSFILHLGDFHYREHACAESSATCGGSPYGDNWDTWEAEFFEPANPLLRKAPWVVMRGNHEDCARAGAGWLFFFALPADRKTDTACESSLEAYKLGIGRTTEGKTRALLVMDTSDEKNSYRIASNCQQYRKDLEKLDRENADQLPEFWLALHQPLWGRNMKGEQQGSPLSLKGCEDKDMKSALPFIREKFEKGERLARLILSGDNHAFQFFWPTAKPTPIQMVAGNGGTKLDTLFPLLEIDAKAPSSKGRELDKEPPKVKTITSFGVEGSNLTMMQHGFTVLRRDGPMWTATQFDSAGGKIVACRFYEAPSADAPGCDEPRTDLRSSDDAPDSESD